MNLRIFNTTMISWNVARVLVSAHVACFRTESSECGQVSSVYFNKIRFARAPLDQLLNCFRIKKGGEHIYIYIFIYFFIFSSENVLG